MIPDKASDNLRTGLPALSWCWRVCTGLNKFAIIVSLWVYQYVIIRDDVSSWYSTSTHYFPEEHSTAQILCLPWICAAQPV